MRRLLAISSVIASLTLTVPAEAIRITPPVGPITPIAARVPWEYLRAVLDYWAALRQPAPTVGLRYTGPECAGRWAIPTWIVWRESRCGYRAENPISSASGAYQFIDSTWNSAARASGYARYVGHASYAPSWAQDEVAEYLWAGGRGCGHWAACR